MSDKYHTWHLNACARKNGGDTCDCGLTEIIGHKAHSLGNKQPLTFRAADDLAERFIIIECRDVLAKQHVREVLESFDSICSERDALAAKLAAMRTALERAANMLGAVAGDLEDGYSLGDIRGKYVMTLIDARDAARLALADVTQGSEG